MTVSGPLPRINQRAGWRRGALLPLGAVVWALALAACLPSIAPATFPASSYTTEPGTLIGPFDGRVVDAQNGRPVPGAVVWVSWRFCRGESVCAPVGNETWSGETDADGRYQTPRLRRFPGAVRLDAVTLVIYKRGYVGYRSDRYLEGQPRQDFAQSRNEVRLDRYPEGLSHAEHLAFLGGDGALRAATRAEALQVSVEGSANASTGAPLDASTLLSVEELRQATGTTEDYTTDRLTDRPRTARYDSVHFRASGGGDESDAAVRVFLADSAEDAEKVFEEVAGDLPNSEAVDPVPAGLGARAARAHDGDGAKLLHGLVLLDRSDRAVVFLTCGASLCKSSEQIDAIGKRVVSRLPGVGRGPLPPDAPGTAHEKAPDEKEKAKEKPPEDPALKLREPGLRR